jgi:hypothetical protein
MKDQNSGSTTISERRRTIYTAVLGGADGLIPGPVPKYPKPVVDSVVLTAHAQFAGMFRSQLSC